MRNALVLAAAVLALTACGGDEPADEPAAAADDTSSSTPSRPTAPGPLQTIDSDACELIADSGDVAAFLDGTATGAETTSGRLDLLTLPAVVGIYVDQVETFELRAALGAVVDEATAYGREFNGGNDNPDGADLLEALLDAASVCNSGGAAIGWYQG